MQLPFSASSKNFIDYALQASKRRGVIINNHTQGAKGICDQVDALSQLFDFIALDDLRSATKEKRERPFCLFTFDDGKKINVEAAEKLYQLGVPATFFICTEYISSGRALWFDELGALARTAPQAISQFDLNEAKMLPFREIRSRLDGALKAVDCHVDLSDPKIGPMDWDDVRGLAKKGFSIGAHGRFHAILTNESNSDAAIDISQSIEKLNVELNVKCRTFAFPNGNFNVFLAKTAFTSGAEFLFTTEPLWTSSKHVTKKMLPRIQLHEKHDEISMKLKLMLARLAVILKDPNGTGRHYIARNINLKLKRST